MYGIALLLLGVTHCNGTMLRSVRRESDYGLVHPEVPVGAKLNCTSQVPKSYTNPDMDWARTPTNGDPPLTATSDTPFKLYIRYLGDANDVYVGTFDLPADDWHVMDFEPKGESPKAVKYLRLKPTVRWARIMCHVGILPRSYDEYRASEFRKFDAVAVKEWHYSGSNNNNRLNKSGKYKKWVEEKGKSRSGRWGYDEGCNHVEDPDEPEPAVQCTQFRHGIFKNALEGYSWLLRPNCNNHLAMTAPTRLQGSCSDEPRTIMVEGGEGNGGSALLQTEGASTRAYEIKMKRWFNNGDKYFTHWQSKEFSKLGRNLRR